MIRKVLVSFVILMTIFSFAACNKTEDNGSDGDYAYTIGVTVMDQANSFWTQYIEPMDAWAQENNVNILYNDGQGKVEVQIAAIENWINMKVDAIVINPLDTVALSTVSKAASDAGIVVVASFYEVEGYDAWLSADQFEMGYTVGKAVAEWAVKTYGDERVEWASTNGDTVSSIIPRREGMEAAMKEFAPNAVLVGTAFGMTAEDGMAATETFLQANPDLKIVIGQNDSSALGAMEAFKAAGKIGDGYCVAGVDASDDALTEMRKEDTIFRFTVNQDPRLFGKSSLEYALKALKGEAFDKDISIPVTLVDREDESTFPA